MYSSALRNRNRLGENIFAGKVRFNFQKLKGNLTQNIFCSDSENDVNSMMGRFSARKCLKKGLPVFDCPTINEVCQINFTKLYVILAKLVRV